MPYRFGILYEDDHLVKECMFLTVPHFSPMILLLNNHDDDYSSGYSWVSRYCTETVLSSALRFSELIQFHDFPKAVMVDVLQLAVNKPSGLQVLPGGLFQQRTVLRQLQWHIAEKERHLQPDEARHWKPAPVHRLGRGTSGLLLLSQYQHVQIVNRRYYLDYEHVV